MTSRLRILITAALVCHLLLATGVVTSQVQPAVAPANPSAIDTSAVPAPVKPMASLQNGEPVTIRAREQEKEGDLYKLRGEAEIDFRTYVLRADEITFNDSTGEATATGNVVFDGGPHDEHITASKAVYNIHSGDGHFYDVVGTTGVKPRGRNILLTSSNPFSFTGKLVDKIGRNKYVVHHGTITSCRMPNPKWTFHAEKVVVVAGEDAKIYNSSFFLGRVPVLYLPFAEHPVENLGRKTGFLLPTIGHSSRKGTILGESVFWAISRSMDLTAGAEYFSKRGWSQSGNFRARWSDTGFVDARIFSVIDRGLPTTQVIQTSPGVFETLPANQDQGGQNVRVHAEGLPTTNLRAVADIEYLSSFLFRAAFSETFAQAINSEVRSTAFLSESYRGYAFGAMGSRYQNFQSVSRGDVITIVHAPSFEISTVDRQIGRSPFYWSFDTAAEGLSRREPSFVTSNVVGRYDIYPELSLPLFWRGWTLRPDVAVRDTYYTDHLLSSGTSTSIGQPAEAGINRSAFQTSFELRPPTLARIFDRPFLGRTFKHTFEPRLVYRYTTGVDNFDQILRMDERDILSNTNELEYAIVNRLYAKAAPKESCAAAPGAAGCNIPAAREVISWELAQKYYFDPDFGGALVNGRRNVFTSTVDFTGIAFLTEPRRFAPVISRLRIYAPRTAIQWYLDYDTKKGYISSSRAALTYRFWREFALSGAHTYLRTPGEILVSTPIPSPNVFNQWRIQLSYGHPNKLGFNAGATVGYDANLNFLQYSAVQTSYNWDCCGVTFEYRRFALGSVRNENQFRFALTLTNVGTAGTLRKQERLY
ncbi:MAG: LPS-assembly protein LptD [Terriglobales bacterium]